jgi:hypothetical protein
MELWNIQFQIDGLEILAIVAFIIQLAIWHESRAGQILMSFVMWLPSFIFCILVNEVFVMNYDVDFAAKEWKVETRGIQQDKVFFPLDFTFSCDKVKG